MSHHFTSHHIVLFVSLSNIRLWKSPNGWLAFRGRPTCSVSRLFCTQRKPRLIYSNLSHLRVLNSIVLTFRMYSCNPATPKVLMTNQTFSERKRLAVRIIVSKLAIHVGCVSMSLSFAKSRGRFGSLVRLTCLEGFASAVRFVHLYRNRFAFTRFG